MKDIIKIGNIELLKHESEVVYMTTDTITKILDNHAISYSITDKKVFADGNYTLNGKCYTDKIDVTNYTKHQLYDWLGY